jgi:hypothetical protein
VSATAYWLRIGGYPATEIAPHTPPRWETLADGGVGTISWTFTLSPRSQHQALRARALVEVMCGANRVAVGLMTEPDRTTWECHASGFAADLRKFPALDGSGNNTRDLAVATQTASFWGWPGSNSQPVTGVAAGDTTGNPVTVGQLYDDYATQTGQRWGCDELGRLFMRPDPTTPTWLTTPDAAAFGSTDDDVATWLAGRFDSGAGFLTAVVGDEGPGDVVDLTDRGAMGLVEAQVILSGMLIRRGGTQWTNGVTLHREQLTTMGGSPAALAAVRAGQMLRVHGLASGVIAQAPWLDITIGKTAYTAGEDTIYLEPVNIAARTARGAWAA